MTPEDWERLKEMNRELLAEVSARSEAKDKGEESGLTPDDVEGIIRCVKAANEAHRRADDGLCIFWLLLSFAFCMFMVLLTHR